MPNKMKIWTNEMSKIIFVSLTLLLFSCRETPDKAKESTIKDKEGNSADFCTFK